MSQAANKSYLNLVLQSVHGILEKAFEEYEANGVVVIPDLFTPEECVNIKKAAYYVSNEDISGAGYPYAPAEYRNGKRTLMFFPALASEYLNQIRTDTRLAAVVSYFLNSQNIKQVNNQIYFREAMDLDSFAWHQDIMFGDPSVFRSEVETDYVQTIIAVDDMTAENGAIEFIPGSHRDGIIKAPRNLHDFIRDNRKGIKYEAKKGSLLLWNSLVIHGSEINASLTDRMTYMNGFCDADVTDSYPFYMLDGVIVNSMDPKKIV